MIYLEGLCSSLTAQPPMKAAASVFPKDWSGLQDPPGPAGPITPLPGLLKPQLPAVVLVAYHYFRLL